MYLCDMSMYKPLYGMDVLMNAALWVLEKLPENERRLHKLFKILWFADLDHLKKYGRTVTGDTYSAMPYGPVPSALYDEIKHPADESKKRIFRFDKPEGKGFLSAPHGPDMDYLSETDVEALQKSFDANKDESFNGLRDKSHKSAWNAVRDRNYGCTASINIDDILDEIGADEILRNYVHDDLCTRNFLSNVGAEA